MYNFDKTLDISQETIDYYHDKNYKVAAYFINSQEDYDTYINEYNVDYVFASKVWE